MTRLPDPMVWLERRVPLTLLLDLLSEQGPDSEAIFVAEQADLAWTLNLRAA